MNETRSAYADEQAKLDNRAQMELELSIKIADLLASYGYTIQAKLKSGVPEVELVALS